MTSTHEARHPVTLFTGQWADLPFDEVARRAAGLHPAAQV